jgi:hypothetical protein
MWWRCNKAFNAIEEIKNVFTSYLGDNNKEARSALSKSSVKSGEDTMELIT